MMITSKEFYTVAVTCVQYAMVSLKVRTHKTHMFSRFSRLQPSLLPTRTLHVAWALASQRATRCCPISTCRKIRGESRQWTTTSLAHSVTAFRSIVERHRRTHLLMLTLVVVFATAWLPLNTFHLANTFALVSRFNVPTFAFCHIIAICSACLNPLSYTIYNNAFRQEFRAMFVKCGLLRVMESIRKLLTRQARTDLTVGDWLMLLFSASGDNTKHSTVITTDMLTTAVPHTRPLHRIHFELTSHNSHETPSRGRNNEVLTDAI